MKCLINENLDAKIIRSKSVIREALDEFTSEDLVVAWTGGKDSTTMLWFYREACKELGQPLPRAIFIDEGQVFDEILDIVYRVRGEWDVDVSFVKNNDVSDKVESIGDLVQIKDLNETNQREIAGLGFTEEVFAFEPESYICNHLMKTVAMNIFIEEKGVKALSTAIRWDEHEARLKEEYFSPRDNPRHTRVHPILHFRERDIWEAIHKHNIPFCSLYSQGYRSLGAKGSTYKDSNIPAWKQDLENTPERVGRSQEKEKIMAQLRSLGYM